MAGTVKAASNKRRRRSNHRPETPELAGPSLNHSIFRLCMLSPSPGIYGCVLSTFAPRIDRLEPSRPTAGLNQDGRVDVIGVGAFLSNWR